MNNTDNSKIAVSCRVRFARNISKFPFASRMTTKQEEEVRELVKDIVFSANSAAKKEFEYIKMEELPKSEAMALCDLRLISKEFAVSGRARGLILSKQRDLSVMINEEDHLRIQAFGEGMELERAYDSAEKLVQLIEASADIAFDGKLGYLTHCPTNLGTAMRASVMLHLPMLTQNGYMEKVVSSASKLGLEVRGLYGEGSTAAGYLYQISNRITMNMNAKEILKLISDDAEKLCAMELELQKKAAQNIKLKDKVARSVGTLKNSYLMPYNELLEHLSLLRIGVNTKMIEDVSADKLNRLLFETTSAGIAKEMVNEKAVRHVDEVRATLIKQILNS